MQDIIKFISGFKRFQEKYFGADRVFCSRNSGTHSARRRW